MPDGFTDLGPAALDLTIEVSLGLKIPNQEAFDAKFAAITDPANPSYGQYLSAADLFAMTDPPQAVVDQVQLWLKTAFVGVQVSYSHGTFKFKATVQLLNTALQTQYHSFKSPLGNTITRALSISIPEIILAHLGYISPGASFDADMAGAPKESTAQPQTLLRRANPCDTRMTPKCLQDLYGIPTARATSQTGNYISVPGYLNEYANKADLGLFLQNYRSDLAGAGFSEVFVDNGKNPQDPNTGGLEANLDIQYTVGVASGVPVTFVSVGLASMQGFMDMADNHISYGFNEPDVTPNEANGLCSKLQQLGARGVSVIVASGDGGVAGSRPNANCFRFIPTFPASCPYVTAVGATQNIPESGADLSAGGFSAIFSMPGYQTTAVSAYLQNIGTQYQGRYNSNGRAFPDVAAIGKSVVVVYRGKSVIVDGTSASAPIFASMVALANDGLLASGRPKLGFLNPWLYSKPSSVFNDITEGKNPSCGTNGFPAMAGWDPVTGLGTPKFTELFPIV
ncbi:hypothetical protein DFQ27_001350 [Actinomortierella ambigua]|uniref:tripeptidyl-peptidase II n=1 Tax=Actinomortierella ambigua TaxID=1343610 RepID=A0A9P6U8W3_9FUNG|nr:hypothetical protein DFQ27_001350 [Actinomortierella ambigua]